ncbi:hypothetical protein QFZ63_006570 [Streptomyces sp. B3I7]|nr:hypothetical protein [Streptomyces sp. B3I7]
MSHFQGQSRTPGVQPSVEHQRAAHAAVPGGHAEQVAGAAAGPVPVFGEGGEVDVVGGEGGTVEAGRAHALREDLPHGGAGRPVHVHRVEREPFRCGHGGRDGQARADAAQAGRAEQVGACLDDGAEHLGRVGVDGLAAGGRGHDPAAEADEGGAVSVGVDLGGQSDGAVLGDLQTVRGAALGAGGGAGVGVDPDQTERLQFGGDRAGGRAGDAEGGGEDGAGGGAAGVHEFECGAEGTAAPVQPCPGGVPFPRRARGRIAAHEGESPMIRGYGRRPWALPDAPRPLR